MAKSTFIEKVGQILNTPNLLVKNQEALIEGLALWSRHNCDFIDAYNAAMMHRDGLPNLAPYDSDFESVPSIRRQEP